jgi:isoleucyl-tRNA synthetase
VLITSYARALPLSQHPDRAQAVKLTNGELVYIQVTAVTYAKCVRCWHRREDVGQYPEHPELCGRCVENVAGPGERRRYA